MDSISIDDTHEFKSVVSNRLSAVSVKTENIAIPLKNGTKVCKVDFTQKRNRRNISQEIGNYAVLAEGRLHFIDLDEPDKVPDSLLQNTTQTFAVASPHGEHRWVISDTPLPNIKRDWGEIRSQNQYVVGPGSKLEDCDNGCCTAEDPGIYRIQNDAPIQEVTKDELGDWIGGFDTGSEEEGFSEDIDLDSLGGSKRLATAQNILKQSQSEHTPFFQDLFDRLNGGRGKMGDSLSKDSGKIDRSRLDLVTLEHLYGVFRKYGKSHSESRGLAGATYSYYSTSTPFTKDGQKRKWQERGKQYKIDMLDNAVLSYNESKFLRLLNQSNDSRRDLNEYSEVTYKIADFVVDWLTNDWSVEEAQKMATIGYQIDIELGDLEAVRETPMYQDNTPFSKGVDECEYPSPKAVRVICSKIDSRSESTYKNTVQRLQNDGNLKVAYLGGNDWRVYQSQLPDPAEAEYIRFNGEKSEVA